MGTVISLLAIASWNWVIPMGVMGLWTTMGNMRKYVATICIIVAVSMYFIQKKNKGNSNKINEKENDKISETV